MGKGRIVSGGEDGFYWVELLHNRDRIEDELAFLAVRLAEMQEELDALNTERDELVAQRDAIPPQIDQAIADYQAQEVPPEEREPLDVEALLVELAQVSAQIQAQDVRIAMIEGRMLEANKRKEALEAIPEDPQQQAWCADHSEALTGEVGTVEVPAEGVVGQFATWRKVIIRPAYDGRASYLPARDGQMHHREGQAGYQAYFNAAILPGVQRHKPQYRIGTITTVDHDADTCSLTIQGEDSSAQALIIDPPDLQYAKTNVPIEYMDCNSAPFEAGDRVLVEFQDRDWQQPKVIGFESDPKRCDLRGIVCTFNSLSYVLQHRQSGWIARQVESVDAGFSGYWRGTHDVVTWSGTVVWARGSRYTFFVSAPSVSQILGACIVADELYIVRRAIISGARSLRVHKRTLTVPPTTAPSGWALVATNSINQNQDNALVEAGRVQFSEAGTIKAWVRSDPSPSQWSMVISFDGVDLVVANPTPGGLNPSFDHIMDNNQTTIFTGCPSGVTSGIRADGSSVSFTSSGTAERTFNGYAISVSHYSTASQVWPAPVEGWGEDRLSIPALGLDNVIVSLTGERGGHRKRFHIYFDRNIPTSAILHVESRTRGEPPPGTHALAINESPDLAVDDSELITTSSWYIVQNSVIGPAYRTESENFGASPGSVKDNIVNPWDCPVPAECGSVSLEDPCYYPHPNNGVSVIASISVGLDNHLHFRPIIIPTDDAGRVLITHPENANNAVLSGGDIVELLGAQSTYLPVTFWDGQAIE